MLKRKFQCIFQKERIPEMGGAAGATAMLMFPPGRRKKACLSIVNVLAISRDA